MWYKKEMSRLDATLTKVPLTLTFDHDLWHWILNVKLYLGNGRPDCHGTKGTGVDRMPWCKILRKWVNWTLRWLGYLWTWPLTFKVKLHHGNGRPDCHGTKRAGVDRMTWCETLRKYVNWMLRSLGYLWLWPLTFKVKLYLGNGRSDCHGTKGTEDDRLHWCETRPLCDLEAEDTVGDRGDYKCRRFRRLV